jgi:hypothetical protein
MSARLTKSAKTLEEMRALDHGSIGIMNIRPLIELCKVLRTHDPAAGLALERWIRAILVDDVSF